MFSKTRKATDKMRLFLQNKVDCSVFLRFLSMSHKKSSKIQAIYDLYTVGAGDVGLKEENVDDDRGHGLFGLSQLNRIARWAQPITYIDICECENFTICIFCFPTSSVIPLHDHPGMTVFSKVLYGSLHVKAYDWVEPPFIQESKGSPYFSARLAKLAVDKVLTASSATSVLYPKAGGNIHCFTAVSPCAVLDVLSPPYNEDKGRRCTYYHDYPYSTISSDTKLYLNDEEVEDHAWLAKIETPDDLYMRPGMYVGPAIQI
ncbi:plant cysteine oxidase 3 isoform X2 [Cucumis melo var. makuwa]|uniref:cysteine dioxygenase n=1 Tax=Cucumis melo var. makuwa TaxID=1194695 RepID=A0A5D3DYD3_CUCMM|nr:plant cysteine oxidase 3 isoform X2 [Cucumis melo var. makuwa]